jgi:hypothetical protein
MAANATSKVDYVPKGVPGPGRCDLRPDIGQTRDTGDCEGALSAAIDRVSQWWPCLRPFSVSVRVTGTSTCSSAILRAAPSRGMPPARPGGAP